MRVWIELDEDRSDWARTRMYIAWLTHAGYVAQVLIGPEPKVLALTAHQLAPAEREAFGRPPQWSGERAADPGPAGQAGRPEPGLAPGP